MADYSSLPMYAYAWADPHVDLENPRFVISVEWTWPAGDWTDFSIVRSTRSPVRRREEGQVMMETKGRNWDHFAYQTTGLPVYRDPQPPPGEWVYYTAFVLDQSRIWNYAGEVYEVSIEDYNWALQLPELFPGVAIADAPRTSSPAEQSNDLVTFLQTPGALLDKVVTMAETAQYYWEPLKVPPQMLKPMTESVGYYYDESLGIGRLRYALDALMGPRQGSLPSIRNFTSAATGCDTRVEISNNLMLDTNDSSFESGLLVHPITGATVTKWLPLANLELRKYENWPDKHPTQHPNTLVEWFLYLKASGTYTCGPNWTDAAVGNTTVIQQGIPVAVWDVARMGVHAYKPSATAVNLSLGLKLYDHLGKFMRDLTLVTPQALTEEWKWYPSAVAGVSMVTSALDPASRNRLTPNQASVETDTTGFVATSNVALTRTTLDAADGTASLNLMCTSVNATMLSTTLTGLNGVPVTTGKTYTAVVSLRAQGSARSTRLDIIWYDVAGTTLSTTAGTLTSDTTTGWTVLTTTAVAPANARFAALSVQVQTVPLNSNHYADKFGFWEGSGGAWVMPTLISGPHPAYAVPWITVSNPCSVDLIVVDDG